MEKRVVVTGIGVEAPSGRYGVDGNTFVPSVLDGVSGIREIDGFAHDELNVHVWGRCPWVTRETVKSLVPKPHRKALRWFSRNTELAVSAGVNALSESGIVGAVDPERFGVVTASDTQDLPLEQMLGISQKLSGRYKKPEIQHLIASLRDNLGSTSWMMQTVPFNPAMALGTLSGAAGVSINISTACAASLVSIGESYWMIRSGRQDAIVAGGVYARLTPASIAGLLALQAIVSPSGPPTCAASAVSRPFDCARDGIVISEGAAFLVLEEYEHAKQRNAPMFGEIGGYGLTTAPGKIVEPDDSWFGKAIAQALTAASVSASSIGHVSAHATSTQRGDVAEAKAIRATVGERTSVSSLKGTNGHLIIASGAMAVAAELLCMCKGEFFPNANLDSPDPACSLRLPTCREPWPTDKPNALVCSAGFGGQHAAAVIAPIST